MGKKVKRKTYISKGDRKSVSNGLNTARSERSVLERAVNKVKAWKKGLNPWITVPGPDKKTPYVKKRANDVYGDYRHVANIYRGKNSDE